MCRYETGSSIELRAFFMLEWVIVKWFKQPNKQTKTASLWKCSDAPTGLEKSEKNKQFQKKNIENLAELFLG